MGRDYNPVSLQPLYRAAEVRAMDRKAIDAAGIPGAELMRRAGAAAFAALRERWPEARTLSVLCGAGNNGGDGYVVARLAQAAGWDVRVYAATPPAQLKGDALGAYQAYRAAGAPCWSSFRQTSKALRFWWMPCSEPASTAPWRAPTQKWCGPPTGFAGGSWRWMFPPVCRLTPVRSWVARSRPSSP